MNTKTNAMRMLDAQDISYDSHYYGDTDAVSGVDVANVLGLDMAMVFKTLVTEGRSGEHYVFIIPVAQELSLKKAAKAAGEKSVDMLKPSKLLGLTGYIPGGCSPIGMKKELPIWIDTTAESLEKVIVSAGKIGYQIELPLADLQKVVPIKISDLTQ